MRLAVDPSRHPAHDDEPGRGELARERPRHRAAVRGAGTSADDRDRWSSRARPPPIPADRAARGGSWIAASSAGNAASRRRMRRLSVTRPTARPACDTTAPRRRASGSTASAPASAAIVRATRATRARPRPESGKPVDRAREELRRRLGPARHRRRASAREPSSTRCRTVCRRLGRRSSELGARGRGIATARSKRSRSARESFSRYAARRCGVHAHSTAGSPRAPHGHMFIVPTSWNRAGKSACPPTRATLDDAVLEWLPERLQHRARELGQLVQEEHAEVRERDLARTRARAAAHDRRRRGRRGAARETAEPRRALVPVGGSPRPSGCASPRAPRARVRAGRIPGSRRASIVFPVPGGPMSSRLCDPAAAISSARRARS